MKRLVVALVLLVGCAGQIEDKGNGWPPSYDPPLDLDPIKLDPGCEQYKFVDSDFYPTQYPVNILLDGKLSAHNRDLMLDAIDAWNARMKMEVVYATVTDNLQMHDKCNFAVVTDTTDLMPGWIGLTSYGACASDIVNVETMDTKMSIPNQAYYTDLEVLNVTIHEIGHVLGLQHEADRNSVMFESIGPEDKRYISEQSYCLVQQAVINTQ
jgi:predicted Zn-dependent protease